MRPLLRRAASIGVPVLVGLFWGPAGCDLLPEGLEPLLHPPRIFELRVVPERVPAGEEVSVHLSFGYEDPDGDVGPESAEVELGVEVLSGDLEVEKPPSPLVGKVRSGDRRGYSGSVELEWLLRTPPGSSGVLRLSVALLDRASQRSNRLHAEIAVASRGGCTFLDGDRNPVEAYRIGRQVFFRVRDPDNDAPPGLVDTLADAVSIKAAVTGDVEVISLVETGPATGLFEGPPGGLLLVARPAEPGDGLLAVRDHGAIIAIYRDPNDPGDVCLTLARIE